jgi:Pvc16 N-terminal domain
VIQVVDARLATWAGEHVKGVQTSFDPPAESRAGEGVCLYLMDVAPRPDEHRDGARRLRASLRYLVTTWAEKPERAHELLGDLLLAALQEAEFEVELESVQVEAWAAFKIAPRPSFVVRVPLGQDIERPIAKLVRSPLSIRASGLVSLNGTVLGPGDVPMAGASVELPALKLSTLTDWKGRFTFSAVPAEPAPKELLVKARGREQRVPVGAIGSPLLINFGPLEG